MSAGGGIFHMINATIMLIVWHKWKRCTCSLKVGDLATCVETKQVREEKKEPDTRARTLDHSSSRLNTQ